MDRTTSPSSQAVSSSAFASSARRAAARHVLGRDDLDLAVVALAPDADDPAVPPGCRAAVAVAVEDLVDVGSEVEAALLPTHGRGVERGQQRRPGPGSPTRVEVVRQQPAGVAVVEGHLDGLRRR